MPDTQPYFAFGANMARRVLVARRRIAVARSEAGYVRDFTLRFNVPGLAPIEPAFASMAPAPGGLVHGVLHYVSAQDLRRLDAIERGYVRLPVWVEGATGRVEATTYVARRTVDERAPSRRYRDVLVEGAREHQLPASWIDVLLQQRTSHVPIVSSAVAGVLAVADRVLGAFPRRPAR